jgi:DNA-binding NtrC family response regulator
MHNILYIDDESGTERFKSKVELLADRGYRVIPVTTVDAVGPALYEHGSSISAVVLDILMPPLDVYSLEETNDGTTTGLSVLRDLRERVPDMPVIIVSVKPKAESASVIAKFGVTSYLQRPVLASAIADALDNVLRQRGR